MASLTGRVGNSRNYHYGLAGEVIVRICQTLAHVFYTVIGARTPAKPTIPAYYRFIEICKSSRGLSAESGEIAAL